MSSTDSVYGPDRRRAAVPAALPAMPPPPPPPEDGDDYGVVSSGDDNNNNSGNNNNSSNNNNDNNNDNNDDDNNNNSNNLQKMSVKMLGDECWWADFLCIFTGNLLPLSPRLLPREPILGVTRCNSHLCHPFL